MTGIQGDIVNLTYSGYVTWMSTQRTQTWLPFQKLWFYTSGLFPFFPILLCFFIWTYWVVASCSIICVSFLAPWPSCFSSWENTCAWSCIYALDWTVYVLNDWGCRMGSLCCLMRLPSLEFDVPRVTWQHVVKWPIKSVLASWWPGWLQSTAAPSC